MKNRKKNTKLVLLVLLVCITLGYAALRTGLNINGTTNVSSASWNVHFENYQMSNATNITPTTEPSISGTTTTSISYEVDLEAPGDLYEFSVEVVNSGSMDALISLVSKYNDTEIDAQHPVPAYIDYVVSDENGDEIVDGHRLNHGSSETVKVYVKYKDDDAGILPSTDATLRFDIEIGATQAPKGAPNVLYTIGSAVDINELIEGNTKTYLTPAEALSKSNTYFKNIVENEEAICAYYIDSESGKKMYYSCGYDNVEECEEEDVQCEKAILSTVREIYHTIVITDELKEKVKASECTDEYSTECDEMIDNLVNGTYSIRVGVDEHNLSSKPIYEANVNVVKQAFNYAVQPDACIVYPGEAIDCGYFDLYISTFGQSFSELGANCRYESSAYCYSDD